MFGKLGKTTICGYLVGLAWVVGVSNLHAAVTAAPKAPVSQSIISQVAAALPMKIILQSADLTSVGVSQSTSIILPGMGAVELIGSGSETLISGNVAWRGYVAQSGKQYRADLILAATGVVGDIRTQTGRYHLETSTAGGQVAIFYSAANPATDKCAGTPVAAAINRTPAALATLDAQLTAAMSRTDTAHIDVMFVYTPGVAGKYGSNLPAVLDSALLSANSAASQSGVGITFALAGSMEVSPRNLVAGDISAALIAVTSSEDNTLPRNADFIDVAARRHALGADIVVLLVTRADYTVGCIGPACMVGTAWQTTRESLSSAQPGLHSYAIVDVAASDLGLTVTHEIGHLLGAGHDYTTGGAGLFADSRGFRSADGIHGDLMSYAPQPSLLFSNPAVACSGVACGADASAPAPADNARALQASRFLVAAYQASVPPAPPDIAGQWWDGQDNGQRLQLARSGNTFTALWFTHSSGGQPGWYVATGCQLQANKCSADLYMSWTYQFGLMSGAALDPSQVMAAKVGLIELDAGNPGALSLAVTLYSDRAVASLTRQFAQADAGSMNGIWWVSSGLESGVTVAQNQDSLSLTWFTYGADGRGSWYTVPDCRPDGPAGSCSGDLYQSSGPASVASNNGVSVVVTQKIGTAGLTFGGSYTAAFRWQIGANAGSAALQREMSSP